MHELILYLLKFRGVGQDSLQNHFQCVRKYSYSI